MYYTYTYVSLSLPFLPLYYATLCSTISLGQVKSAMLLVEAALPAGAIDNESEERWGDGFAQSWREAVATASDATQLMQCQVMLEYGIRTVWYTHEGLRLFACMPARLTGAWWWSL